MSASAGQAALSPRKEEDSGWFGWAGDAADWVSDKAVAAKDATVDAAVGTAKWAGETYDDTAEWVGETYDDTAEWVGETYDDTAEWVDETVDDTVEWAGETYDDTAEWVGEKATTAKKGVVKAAKWTKKKATQAVDTVVDAVEDTVDAGREAWEAIASVKFSWNKGVLTVVTDLDEVMDIMPASVKAQLQLDRAAASNKVTIVLNTNTRNLSVSTGALVLTGISSAKLTTGEIALHSVSISMSNYGGGLPFLGGDFSVFGYKIGGGTKDTTALVNMSHATAKDVSWTGKGGPVSFESLNLDNFSGALSTDKGGDISSGSVALESAVMHGLMARGVAIDQADALDLKADVDGKAETAHLDAGALRAQGVSHGSRSVETAELLGADIDLTNTGGGMPLLDDKADNLHATVGVENVGLTNYRAPRAGVASASLSNVGGQVDVNRGSTQVEIGTAKASGVDAGWVDIGKGEITNATIAAEQGKDGRAHKLGLFMDKMTVDGAGYHPLPEELDSEPLDFPKVDWDLGVDDLAVNDITTPGAKIARPSLKGGAATGSLDQGRSWFDASAKEGHGYGLDHTYIDLDEMHTRDARLVGHAGQSTLTAGHSSMKGVKTESFKAAEITGDGGSARFDPSGLHATMDKARMTDALIEDRIGIASADVSKMDASRVGDVSRVGFETGVLKGLHDKGSDTKVGTIRAGGASVLVDDEKFTGDVKTATASQITSGPAAADNASAQGFSFRHQNDALSMGARKLGVSGAKYGDNFSAQQLDATGVGTTTKNGAWDVNAGTLQGEQVLAAQRVGADLVDTKGFTGRFDDKTTTMGLESAEITNLGAGSRPIDEAALGDVATADKVSIGGLTTSAKGGVWDVGAQTVGGKNVGFGGALQSEGLRTTGFTGQFGGDTMTMGLDTATMDSVTAGDNLSADNLSGTRLSSVTRGDDWNLKAGTLGGDNMLLGGRTSIGAVRSTDAHAHLGADGSSYGAHRLGLNKVSDKPSQTTVGSANLLSPWARVGDNSISGTVARGAASDVAVGDSLKMSSVAVDRLNGGYASDLLSADVKGLSGGGLRYKGDGTRVNAGAFSADNASLLSSKHQTRITADRMGATNAMTEVTPGTGGGGSGPAVDTARLIETGAARLDDAHITGSAPMHAGDLGPVEVERGTIASGEATIQDGRFVKGQTGATFSKPLDGPVWTSVRGAYLDKKNKMRADVKGWGDRNISRDFNKQLGIDSSRMPSVGTLGGAVADTMRKPSTGEATPNPFDFDNHTLSGDASFSAGLIDAGESGSVTLGQRTKAGDNAVNITSRGQTGLHASSSRIVADQAAVKTGSGDLKTGKSTVSGADFVVLPDGTITTKAKAIELRNLEIRNRALTLGKQP